MSYDVHISGFRSTGALHRSRDSVDAQEQNLSKGVFFMIGCRIPTPHQLHLRQIQNIGIRIAQSDGFPDHRGSFE